MTLQGKKEKRNEQESCAAGSATVLINGIPAAVTGSAISCGGVTIGSVVIGDTHSPAPFSGISPASAKSAPQAESSYARRSGSTNSDPSSANGPANSASSATASWPAASSSSGQTPMTSKQKTTVEPGFHVVPRPMSKAELLVALYGDASAKPNHFDRLNPGLGGQAP
ncbi:MAG: hypothetical protein HLUCCX14_17785 [Marinobacter excellens HL-55]|uniref:PAAR motif n=1 Tax=Marinobacter excellens HL-55 TaxID=1305731 RepID=A0A0P8CTH3_9GAMM|nr:MAG: hypothetical protein HLUCCX14_17785 [Marinobacter excellens HL-55]